MCPVTELAQPPPHGRLKNYLWANLEIPEETPTGNSLLNFQTYAHDSAFTGPHKVLLQGPHVFQLCYWKYNLESLMLK